MCPLYEYSCSNCSHTDEKLESFSALPTQDCPSCKYKGTFIRKINVPGIMFTGKGWAKDLYASSK